MNSVLATIADTRNRVGAFHRLGGSDSFFGRMYVFEDLMQEQHDKAGVGKDAGMYAYHGMNQYGNIVEYGPLVVACHRFIEEFGYSREQLEEIRAWYEKRGSIDCAMAHACIASFLRGKDPLIKVYLEEASDGD